MLLLIKNFLTYEMLKSWSMLNCILEQKHIKIFIVLKHPSGVSRFDDLSNFVNDVTVNVVTHYVETTLTIMTFFHRLEAGNIKIAKK